MRYLLLFISMFLAVTGQIFIKKGVVASSLQPSLLSVIQTLFTPLIITGLAIYGASSIIWLFVLQKFPLSVAYPALSLTYIFVVAISIFLFKEPFSYYKLSGIILIVSGVYFLFK